MAKTLYLNLVTPQKQLLDGVAVESVVLPAAAGELGVLPGHLPMIVQLGFGSLRYKKDGKEEEFAVMGGLAEILREGGSVYGEIVKSYYPSKKQTLTICYAKDPDGNCLEIQRWDDGDITS